jgi:hypothetical protein
VRVEVVQGPAIEDVLGRELPFKAPKALFLSGTAAKDWDLVLECLEPLVDAVAGELWTVDGRVIYRGQGRRLSFEELNELWRGIVHAHELKEALERQPSHARRTLRAPKGPNAVAKATAWSDVPSDEPDDDVELSG